MTDVAMHHRAPLPTRVTQTTAVEQARAVAEVQAAVIVAQQVPRDMDRAWAEMRQTCGRLATANRAFYSVPNRGQGPSVHLARELARIWGNVQYGVVELRRDDAAGESEIEAFAWDVQTNTRSKRGFVAPHQRMKGKERQKLTDLGDVYLNNQNVGARAVRECIFTVLPSDFVAEAEDLCRATIERGDGAPLDQRVQRMIDAFAGIKVTVKQLEERIGRKRGQWTAADVAQTGVVFQSIQRGDTTRDDEFPPERASVAEVKARAGQPPADDTADVLPDAFPVEDPPGGES